MLRIYREIAAKYWRSLFDTEPTESQMQRCIERLQSCVDFHLEKMQEGKNTNGSDDSEQAALAVIDKLESGHTATHEVTTNILEEVVLAVGTTDSDSQVRQKARNIFLMRFHRRAQEYMKRFPACGNQEYADSDRTLVEIFLEPRARSGPRIDGYRGRTPLWAYIKGGIKFDYLDWVEHVSGLCEVSSGNGHLESGNGKPVGGNGHVDGKTRAAIERCVHEARRRLDYEDQICVLVWLMIEETKSLISIEAGEHEAEQASQRQRVSFLDMAAELLERFGLKGMREKHRANVKRRLDKALKRFRAEFTKLMQERPDDKDVIELFLGSEV